MPSQRDEQGGGHGRVHPRDGNADPPRGSVCPHRPFASSGSDNGQIAQLSANHHGPRCARAASAMHRITNYLPAFPRDSAAVLWPWPRVRRRYLRRWGGEHQQACTRSPGPDGCLHLLPAAELFVRQCRLLATGGQHALAACLEARPQDGPAARVHGIGAKDRAKDRRH